MAHLLAMLLLAVNTLMTSASNCPPANDILPCKCRFRRRGQILPMSTLSCDNISSVASVLGTLERHFTGKVHLVLTRLHSSPLTPRSLGRLKLERLEIRDSNVHYITKYAFDGQPWLEVLILDYDRLEYVEDLRQLRSLEELSLAGNLQTKIHDRSFKKLYSLKRLTLSGNRISEIDKKAFPKNLNILAITRNLLSTFNGSLKSLKHLEEVYASRNRFTSFKGEFDGIVRLKKLVLDHNKVWNISGSFSNLASLEFLNLARNRIRNIGNAFEDLRKLKVLNLARNRITELLQSTFSNMEDLQDLDLSGNFVTSICPAYMSVTLNTLKLSDMRLKNFEYFGCLIGMDNLMTLDLSRNQFSTLRDQIQYNERLTYLDISFNNFSSLKNLHLPVNENPVVLNMRGNPWRCTKKTMSIQLDMEGKGYEFQGHPRCFEKDILARV